MASTPVFNLLCFAQLVLGGLMFVFGIVDRTCVELIFSFLMLPIWIGILVGVAGISGIVVGRRNERQGYVGVNAVSGIRAVNTMCIGLSLLAFLLYGQSLASIAWQLEASPEYVIQQSALKPPPSADTIQGIVSVILILSLAEMFVGAWLALLEKDQMIFGTVPRQDRPFVANEAAQPQMGIPQTAFHPSQLPQQQAYMGAQGSNPPGFPGNQVYVPSNQQQQQQQQQKLPHYVAVQNPFPASNMVPSNTGMVTSNPNMVLSNPNMVSSNTNMVPSNTNMSSQQGPQRLHGQQSDASGPTNLQVEGRGAVY